MRCVGKNSGTLRLAVTVYIVALVAILCTIIHGFRHSSNAFTRHFAEACIGLLSAACSLCALLPFMYKALDERETWRTYLFAAAHVACVSTVAAACVLSAAVLVAGEYTPAQRNCAAIVIGFHWGLLVLFMHDYTVLAIFLKNIFSIKCCPQSMQKAQDDLINDLNNMIGEDEQKFWGLTGSDIARLSSLSSQRHQAAANQLIEHLQNKLPQHVDAV